MNALRNYLKHGGIIAYPTESCYGLGCDPRNRDAVKKILRLKKRPQTKGLIVIAAKFSQVRPFVKPLSPEQQTRTRNTWPGPHTWLIPASARCPSWLTGQHHTIAVRVTAHPAAAQLCSKVGMALVSTSANMSGGKPARTARDCLRLFGARVLMVSGSIGKQRKPSTVQDIVSGKVIRD